MKSICSRVLILIICALSSVALGSEAERVVIVANSNDPGSVEIARYYAIKREIPVGNIIALPMPRTETITIREYVDTIYNPLLGELVEKGWVQARAALRLIGSGACGCPSRCIR